jgi:hypothetical protein
MVCVVDGVVDCVFESVGDCVFDFDIDCVLDCEIFDCALDWVDVNCLDNEGGGDGLDMTEGLEFVSCRVE